MSRLGLDRGGAAGVGLPLRIVPRTNLWCPGTQVGSKQPPCATQRVMAQNRTHPITWHRSTQRLPMADPYLTKIHEYWDAIMGMYLLFESKHPIIEFDVVLLQVKACPAQQYLDRLTERTRQHAKSQYQQAVADGEIFVFVLDEPNRVFRSYIFPQTPTDSQ